MKKLIIIMVLFLTMMAAAFGEMIFISRFYSKQLELLNVVEEYMDIDPESIDRTEVVESVSEAVKHFENGKKYVMMLGNHNTVKYVDEKLVALNKLVNMNQQYDAYVALKTAKSYIEGLKEDVLPRLTNLF